jgi:uncharacterized repeat protein (TIGR01451 family)
VAPLTLLCFCLFASSAFAGNFWATGHDQDFHCAGGDVNECAYYQLTTSFVRAGSSLPILILDRDNSTAGAPGSTGTADAPLEAVQALNLAYSNDTSTTPTPSSPAYVVEDPQGLQTTVINGTPPAGISTASTWATTPLLDTKGNPLWSAIIVASDTNCGGCDLNNTDGTHVDSDAINQRTAAIQSFFNAGGGLLYLAGATNAYQADGVAGNDVYYASVPVPVGGQPVNAPFTVTSAGATLGVTDQMVNCCATHNSFSLPSSGSPVQVAETDGQGLAESLFLQGGSVCSSGFCSALTTAKTADSATVAAGGQDGYTITISNSNQTAVTLTSFTDSLAAGFTYVAGSSTGATTADPTISGQTLTWSGSFSVPAGGTVSLHFNVTAPNTGGGPFYDNAGGTATGGSVTPTGPTAPVTVTPPNTTSAHCKTGQSCQTNIATAVSDLQVTALPGHEATLTESLDLGSRLECAGYRAHDPNWFGFFVTTSGRGKVLIYTLKNTLPDATQFCFGAPYEFKTNKGVAAGRHRLPDGSNGFVGLLGFCRKIHRGPCIASRTKTPDASSSTGFDTVLEVRIPAGLPGDPWGRM